MVWQTDCIQGRSIVWPRGWERKKGMKPTTADRDLPLMLPWLQYASSCNYPEIPRSEKTKTQRPPVSCLLGHSRTIDSRSILHTQLFCIDCLDPHFRNGTEGYWAIECKLSVHRPPTKGTGEWKERLGCLSDIPLVMGYKWMDGNGQRNLWSSASRGRGDEEVNSGRGYGNRQAILTSLLFHTIRRNTLEWQPKHIVL